MPVQTSTNADDVPERGELYRLLPDGRYAMFFDSHTIGSFQECEQKGVYSVLERLRRKGPDRPCISIGSWWSKVSEKFYEEAAASSAAGVVQYVPIARMARIAIEAWVENNMDVMAYTHPKKYEEFAMPCDAALFASLLGLPGFDHAMLLTYQQRATRLRRDADEREVELNRNRYKGTDQNLIQAEIEQQLSIDRLRVEADRLDKLNTLPVGPILMAVQYYNQYAENDFRNWRIIGAENPFGGKNEVLVGEDDKVVVYYQGRPDLIVYDKQIDALMPLDQKTKDYIDYGIDLQYKPHSQMTGYVYATQTVARSLGWDRVVDRCIVSVCARKVRKTALKKGETPKPRFRRVFPTFNPQEVQEWQRTIMKKANALRRVVKTNDPIRADGFACHVYGGCDYRLICSQPEGGHGSIKKADYVKVKPWSPLFEDEDDD